MKLNLILLFALLAFGASAQVDITPKVTEALSAGDSKSLSVYFAANVDLTLPNQEDMYSKDAASKLVAEFFSKHAAKSFEDKHRGTSKLNDHYRIGELHTGNGEFRVTFFMRKEGENFKISQFRIELAEED